jgi:hypothetical protein
MIATQPKSVLKMILEWSAGRRAWQQDALRRIVAKGTLDEGDHAEILQLCKKGCGEPGVELARVPLSAEHVPSVALASGKLMLTAIADIRGVNRLAPGQELPFQQDGISIIYGDNGAGKSGYARILKRACRARFPGEILPNAFDPTATKGARAKIAYCLDGTLLPSVEWKDDGVVHPILSAVSVFDRESGQVHIREKNGVAFRPFGLDIPDELAAACVAIKDALTAEQVALASAQDEVFTVRQAKLALSNR